MVRKVIVWVLICLPAIVFACRLCQGLSHDHGAMQYQAWFWNVLLQTGGQSASAELQTHEEGS